MTIILLKLRNLLQGVNMQDIVFSKSVNKPETAYMFEFGVKYMFDLLVVVCSEVTNFLSS